MDLFEIKLPRKRLHPYFKSLIDEEHLSPVRDVIQSWGTGLLDRKNEQEKFVNEFQITFNSAFWELYLNKVFMSLNMVVNYTKESPDFHVTTADGYSFNVEAVVADPTINDAPQFEISDEEDFIDDCTIKLLGKIKQKLDLFNGTKGKRYPYSSLSHVDGKPFIIAVAPFNRNYAFSQNNIAINRVLFGIDRPMPDGKIPLMETISKPNGTKLDLGIFTNDSFKEISAIIFSTTGMLGKAIIESRIPCSIRATRYRQIYQYDFLKEEGLENLGMKYHKISPTHEIFTNRFEIGKFICGSDVHLCHSSEYQESHVDGLHVYFNPYALIPLEENVFDDFAITHNFYDIDRKECIMVHHDNSLVSRQVFNY
ncbi:hypothetical protein P0E69_17405 [Chimaeribacter arupi]|uniref:RES domain-containing protein n=1 Tax=Nissabacter archeti TaxID=1917880 RepID=A0ABS5JN60_9GAMM|nr:MULTISPECIES: hypothetical protein [Yersiniaceae]MBS0971435.1 hypothetical protein [Nissabacter archeti]WKZ91933.1 hypothetical protein P0E69_17405 [Chimaeribacter arupi]